MAHYIHHILFDPLSAVEQAKAGIFVLVMSLPLSLIWFAITRWREDNAE